MLWIRDAATLQWTYLTTAFETIYGIGREEALGGENHRLARADRSRGSRAGAASSIERVRQGEQASFEYRVRRPAGGEIRWLRSTDFPIRDRNWSG
ncbi:PAS domain-containing protein [Sphingomonas sp. MMS24-JH45]